MANTGIVSPECSQENSSQSHDRPKEDESAQRLVDMESNIDHDIKDGATAPVATPPSPLPTTIKIRDLAHIYSLIGIDGRLSPGPGVLHASTLSSVRYDISDMPMPDVVELVAGMLIKITKANGLTHNAELRNAAYQRQASLSTTDTKDDEQSPLEAAILAFHGRNVPAIGLHAYLARIHKYCPTTFEVFVSLVVYFDRMTEHVNELVVVEREADEPGTLINPNMIEPGALTMDPTNGTAARIARGDTESVLKSTDASPGLEPALAAMGEDANAVPSFVVDTYNIHRLVIAGVTCASKYFSDIFYTNSRYAKVCFSGRF